MWPCETHSVSDSILKPAALTQVDSVSEFRFGKKRRLLGASDFQPVFKNARFKVSCQHLLVLAVPGNLVCPRLGLVIAKKNISRAVDRNRVKRILRESFRHNQGLLPAVDIVILARSGIGSLGKHVIRSKIEKLWQDLIQKSGRPLSHEAN